MPQEINDFMRGKLFDAALENALARGQMAPELRLHINDSMVRLVHWFEQNQLEDSNQ